jgi:hypothetical protein
MDKALILMIRIRFPFESPPHSLLINQQRKETWMQPENEKAVRTLFEQWWNDKCANMPILDYGYQTLTQDIAFHAFKAALRSQVSNTDGWEPRGTYVEVERGAVQLAINVLRRAGKNEVADELMKACRAPKATQQVSNTPQDGAPDQSVYNTIASRYFASPPQQQEQSGEAKPVAWVRFCSNGGYEGPIMDCDKRMDGRRESGVWTPLYAPTPTATASQESTPTSDQTGREPT